MAPSRPRSLRTLTFGFSKRPLSPSPPSPTFSDVTNVSAMNFGANGPSKIITRANLKASIQAYEDVVSACSTYRGALVAMSKATAAFADALGRCSGLKGPSYEAGTRLQAASGMQHLIGNLHHVLADTIDTSFEKPLRQHLETYRTTVHERSQSYERALREKSQIIRDTEMRSLNRKERNLQSFREALAVLQQQVDDLDELKVSHYQEIVEHEEQVWDAVQSKSVPDPFDSYGPPQSEDQIFSILAPLSIMTAPSPSPSPSAGTPETEATSTLHKITSWLPGTSNGLYPVETSEWATASPPSSPPLSASTSPTSSSAANNRRHSVPQRKAESRLRSVLPSIDESRTPHRGSFLSSSAVSTPPPPPPNTSEILKTPVARPPMTSSAMSNPSSTFTTINTTMPSQNSGSTTTNGTSSSGVGVSGGGFGIGSTTFGFGLGSWNFGYGHQPPTPGEDDESQSPSNTTTSTSTPRMSTLLTPPASQSPPPPPPGSPPSMDLTHPNTTNRDKREDIDQEPVFDPVPS
ncbi:hypothetical protein H1R20_g3441, partial [Candolleomyces eurysporus]